MPRLRRLKIYEPIPIEYESEDSGEEWSNNNDVTEGTDGEFGPEKGWLSTANIILNLNDARIKTAIGYHKEQIRILEQELLSRRISNSNGNSTHRKNVLHNCTSNQQGCSKTSAGLSREDKSVKRAIKNSKILSAGQKSLIFQIYLDAVKQYKQGDNTNENPSTRKA